MTGWINKPFQLRIGTWAYLSRTVTGPDGEDVDMELEVRLSPDGEVIGLRCVMVQSEKTTIPDELNREFRELKGAIPDWAMLQIDMMELEAEAAAPPPGGRKRMVRGKDVKLLILFWY